METPMTFEGEGAANMHGSAANHALLVSILEKLADRWPTLTNEELQATHGQRELVEAVLRAKTDYAELLICEALGQPRRREWAAASHRAHVWPKLAAPLVAVAGLAIVLSSRL